MPSCRRNWQLVSGGVAPGAPCASGLRPVSGAHRSFEADRQRATQRQSLRVSIDYGFRAGFSGALSPDTRAAGKLVNFVFSLRRTPNGREARGEAAYAHTFCFLRDRSLLGLGRLGDGGGLGVVLWRSRTDRGASQPADGIAGEGPQSRQRPAVIVGSPIGGRSSKEGTIDVSTAAAVKLGFRYAGRPT